MARVLKNKQLVHTKLATNYGGWMYCTNCNENIGYLCYSTYDYINLNYQCNCGSIGSATLEFVDSKEGTDCGDALIIIKNRLCCPKDQEPLITLLEPKLKQYEMEIVCKSCNHTYQKKKG